MGLVDDAAAESAADAGAGSNDGSDASDAECTCEHPTESTQMDATEHLPAGASGCNYDNAGSYGDWS